MSKSSFFAFLALLVTPALEASCLVAENEPYLFLLHVQVETCESSAEYANRVMSSTSTPFQWLRAPSSAQPGIVITGAIHASVGVWASSGLLQVGPRLEPDTGTNTWYYPGEGLNCKDIAAGDLINFYQSFNCCDTVPPSSYECFFGIREAAPVPAELEGQLPEDSLTSHAGATVVAVFSNRGTHR